MEVFNFKTLRPWLLGALIVLIPIWLSDLFGTSPRPALPAPPSAPTVAAKPALKLNAPDAINRDAFLASFIRQAGADLLPCVRGSLGPTGSVTFLARLTKRGELTGVRLIEPRSLDCAVEATRAMNFANVTAPMKNESLEINWRFDW